ncbi:MAG: polymerase subunit gamma/tau [Candidatus Saccharibacteria bacterium]|nr:polymerase subunit gamma/tau [Candidatus Saccharibacteria bacterium]
MGQALYRKHRPKSLSEIVGQEHITQTLAKAVEQGKISHAYLFTGPRGVGKTSIARIMAHQINDLPYTDDSAHLDIIEIDAASNRRIDEIRELRDKVYVAPTSAKYKVYIIDEVHMLTKEAFNALLKTLEEPPAHVVFILATTDAHKLPDTIVSRTQRFSFKPVEQAKVVAHLKKIAQDEEITVSDDALELLATHGEGSFRDSISLLDQASSYGKKLELDDVQTLLGIPPSEALEALLSITAGAGSSSDLISNLNGLYDQGYQATAIAKQLALLIRGQIVDSSLILPADQAFQLLDQLIEVPIAHDPERFLEICLLRIHNLNDATGSTAPKPRPTTPSVPPAVPDAKDEAKPEPKPEPAPKAPKPPKPEPEAEETPAKPKDEPQAASAVDDALWPKVLLALKQKHNTLYGVVRMAQPTFTDDGLRLAFQFAFHQKRIGEAANRQILVNIITELTGAPIAIECIYDKSAVAPHIAISAGPVPAEIAPPADISAISNIFGGGELLES